MTEVTTGFDCYVARSAVVGAGHGRTNEPTVIGDGARIRSGTVVYADVQIGDGFSTGHNALVRERSRLGDDVVVGTNAVVDGRVTMGSGVSLQTGAYVPPETTIGDEVFLGPSATLTNDHYPVRVDDGLDGPTIEDHVSVGANATVLPGVRVGRRSFVAAGAVVTDDVPPRTLAVGVPASHEPLPEALDAENSIA